MRIDQLDGLVAFRCVAEERSFTAAAARLDISPQAVSQAVKSLEARLGVRLFHRTTRSVSLSEAGERLWSRAGTALADLFDATESVQEFRDKPIGLLRLGVSRPAYTSWLQPALAEFHAAYPGIRLELSFDDGFVDIVAQGLDAGVRLGHAVAQDMVSVKVTAPPTGRRGMTSPVPCSAATLGEAGHDAPPLAEQLGAAVQLKPVATGSRTTALLAAAGPVGFATTMV